MKVQSSKFKVQSYYKKIISYFADNLERGQIVLILVLVTVVGLTVGLSLISRTVTDVRISSQIEQSSRAFSAAEAGIESALKTATSGETGSVTLPGASALFEVADIGGETGYIYNSPFTETSTTQTLWLRDHYANGMIGPDTENEYPANKTLDICWGTGDDNKAAIVLTILYYHNQSKEYRIAKDAYDVVTRNPDNKFTLVTETTGGYCDGNFKYRQRITPGDIIGILGANVKLIAIRFQPIYTGTIIAVKPESNQNLAVQGKKITSSGQTETGVVRKIQVTQGYNTLPSLFDFTLSVWNASCP